MGANFRAHDISDILTKFKILTQAQHHPYGVAYQMLAEEYQRTPDGIARLIRRFAPTTDSARDFIKASALKLAMRIVRKANVDQAIDVLSRPNVGVLDAPQQAQAGGGGFFLSVQAENLGAVRVGIQGGPAVLGPGAASLPSAPSSGASGRAELEEWPGVAEMEEEEGVRIQALGTNQAPRAQNASPVTLPGVPHPYQGTLKDKPLSPRQQAAVGMMRKQKNKRISERRKSIAKKVKV